ncbi:MAG: hypothetical protein ABIK92_03805 [Pseudomonadota bacterium]
MFKNIFNRNKPIKGKGEASEDAESDPTFEAVMRSIEAERAEDPFIGAKIGAKEVFHRIFKAMKDDRGVHIESLLCVLGALAGYSCQANLRAQAIEKGVPENTPFVVMEANDGKKYFFGDPLNRILAEGQLSVWSLAVGAAQDAGCEKLIDLQDIFKHVTASVGKTTFGIPRLPDDHPVSDKPINYLRALWPQIFEVAKWFCQKPSEWPVLFGLAIQEAIYISKESLPLDLALTIVMESAIPMSKVDLTTA